MALPRWCPTALARFAVNQAANLSCWHHACWGEYWNNSRAVRDARLSVSAPALFCLRLQRYGAKYRPHEFFRHFFQKILQNYLSVLIFRYLAYNNRYAVAGIRFPCPPLLILRTVVMLVILSYCQSWFSKREESCYINYNKNIIIFLLYILDIRFLLFGKIKSPSLLHPVRSPLPPSPTTKDWPARN